MSQHIDIGKNIRESLVVNKQPVETKVNLADLLEKVGVDSKVILDVSNKLDAHTTLPESTRLAYNSISFNGVCSNFKFNISELFIDGKVCLLGASEITVRFGDFEQTVRANIAQDGLQLEVANLGKLKFSLRGRCLFLKVSTSYFNITLYEDNLFCL